MKHVLRTTILSDLQKKINLYPLNFSKKTLFGKGGASTLIVQEASGKRRKTLLTGKLLSESRVVGRRGAACEPKRFDSLFNLHVAIIYLLT